MPDETTATVTPIQQPEPMPPKHYAHFLSTTEYFKLDVACIPVWKAFQSVGYGVYLVGSVLRKRDWRDVDIRVILEDKEFDRLFPKTDRHGENSFWKMICISMSNHLSSMTGLPIDLQIQRQTQANEKFTPKNGHHRSAIGLFVHDYDHMIMDEAKTAAPAPASPPASTRAEDWTMPMATDEFVCQLKKSLGQHEPVAQRDIRLLIARIEADARVRAEREGEFTKLQDEHCKLFDNCTGLQKQLEEQQQPTPSTLEQRASQLRELHRTQLYGNIEGMDTWLAVARRASTWTTSGVQLQDTKELRAALVERIIPIVDPTLTPTYQIPPARNSKQLSEWIVDGILRYLSHQPTPVRGPTKADEIRKVWDKQEIAGLRYAFDEHDQVTKALGVSVVNHFIRQSQAPEGGVQK